MRESSPLDLCDTEVRFVIGDSERQAGLDDPHCRLHLRSDYHSPERTRHTPDAYWWCVVRISRVSRTAEAACAGHVVDISPVPFVEYRVYTTGQCTIYSGSHTVFHECIVRRLLLAVFAYKVSLLPHLR